jgi:hypothetical protein
MKLSFVCAMKTTGEEFQQLDAHENFTEELLLLIFTQKEPRLYQGPKLSLV